ncbi:Tol-Pal system beta propeller repeat protein TolB [Thiomicrorhabdus sp. 6S3-12]|uniref:Tol-Pal system beta propeller repeat protein TolB n=1 Tax=Thiomicrorhabdus sp. 6S3-12 TaxID=2819681 RepID=UPI001AADB8DA|nr:Tol-Pal system beta propeller repeat protein TolB [Thiomicrorhabdus sp. 6S3-12]MBO1924307.1 Tol-Pal system beta propeller repeat protein TolB [Thiomicrorhabdus sp. 6S3-12]
MHYRNLWALSLSLILMLFSAQSKAALTIEISEGFDNALPIAVVPFQSSDRRVQDLAQVVSADLKRSGRFKPLSSGQMPALPSELNEIDYAQWRPMNIDNMVIGKVIRLSNGFYQVDMRLVNVLRKEQVMGKRWSNVPEASLRQVAHQISDAVYEELTGIRGAFNTQIAYVTMLRGAKQRFYTLEVADADGYNPQPILKSSKPIMSPSWSPDGSKLAYVSFEENRSQVYVQSLDGTYRKKIAGYRGINSSPAWSPDGTQLALTLSKGGNADIYIMDVASGSLKQVTRDRAIETEATWAPDGKSLFFNSDRRGQPQVFQVFLDSMNVQRITFEGKYNSNPEVSPDGRYVAVVHGGGGYHIGLLDQQTKKFEVITDTFLDESPSFSPNGEMILYAMNKGGRGQLAVVTVDGKTSQTLQVKNAEVREPAWGPYLNR